MNIRYLINCFHFMVRTRTVPLTIERDDLSAGLDFLEVQADELYVIKVLIE